MAGELREGFKTMVSLSINKEGVIGITHVKEVGKEFVLRILEDARKVAELMPENRIIVSPGGLRNWMQRNKNKSQKGAFGKKG